MAILGVAPLPFSMAPSTGIVLPFRLDLLNKTVETAVLWNRNYLWGM